RASTLLEARCRWKLPRGDQAFSAGLAAAQTVAWIRANCGVSAAGRSVGTLHARGLPACLEDAALRSGRVDAEGCSAQLAAQSTQGAPTSPFRARLASLSRKRSTWFTRTEYEKSSQK